MWKKTHCIPRIAMSVLIVTFCRMCAAQTHNHRPVSNTVTLNVYHASLRQTLDTLFQSLRLPYRIEPDIQDYIASEYRTVHLARVPLEIALERLLISGDFHQLYHKITYHIEHGVYVIGEDHAQKVPRITLSLQETTPQEVLDAIFSSSAVDCLYVSSLAAPRKIRFAVHNASPKEALEALLRACQARSSLRVSVFHDIYLIQPVGASGHTRDSDPSNLLQQKVSLHFSEVNTDLAVLALFELTRNNYVCNRPIPSTISLDLHDTTFRSALEEILKHLNRKQVDEPLTYKIENGIYSILLKVEDTPPSITARPQKASQ